MFLLLPIGNTDSKVRRLPWVTLTIIGLCVLIQVWGLFVNMRAIQFRAQNLSMDPDLLVAAIKQIHSYHPILQLGYVPAEAAGHGPFRILTAAFVHGGWMHLAGNMFFLYTVGCNIEDRWGRGPFVLVYIAGALISSGVYTHFHPDSLVPLVGASGAVSALMGAFVVYFFFSRICFFWFFWYFFRSASGDFSWPAWAAIGFWISLQVLMAWLETQSSCVSVAYTAHVGGFAFGLATGMALRFSGVDAKLDDAQQKLFDGQEPKQEYAADPRVVEATQLLGTSPAQAIAMLGAVVRESAPATLSFETVRALLDAMEMRGDANSFTQESPAVMVWARTKRDAKLANTLVRVGLDKRAHMQFSELDWAYVVAAARECKDPEVVVHATGRLVSEHAGSRYIPKAMFETAMAQLDAVRPELAKATLQRLISEHGATPFAARARDELARMG